MGPGPGTHLPVLEAPPASLPPGQESGDPMHYFKPDLVGYRALFFPGSHRRPRARPTGSDVATESMSAKQGVSVWVPRNAVGFLV